MYKTYMYKFYTINLCIHSFILIVIYYICIIYTNIFIMRYIN